MDPGNETKAATVRRMAQAEIPGFYFDAERQRYYRRPPQHFSHLPQYSGLGGARPGGAGGTEPDAAAASREEPSQTGQLSPPGLSHCSAPRSVFDFVQSRQYQPRGFCVRSCYESYAYSLRKTASYSFSQSFVNSDIMHYHMMLSSSGDFLVLTSVWRDGPKLQLYGVQTDKLCQFKPFQVPEASRSRVSLDLHTEGEEHTLLASDSTFPFAIFKFRCHPRQNSRKLRNFQVVEVNERFVGHSRPERGDGCCCGALNHNPLTRDRYFGAVGSDSGRVRVIKRLDEPCYLREELPRRGVKSVALCLAFGKQTSTLYCGHRNGRIEVWDMREPAHRPSSVLSEPRRSKGEKVVASVKRIHTLSDDNYIISNSLRSQLSMWDVRMRRKILHFNEHINSYASVSSVVGPKESFLAADCKCSKNGLDTIDRFLGSADSAQSFGSDREIRIWSLRDASLLRSISPLEYESPPPPANEERGEVVLPPVYPALPGIDFTENFASCQGPPSLLVAIGSNLVCFTV